MDFLPNGGFSDGNASTESGWSSDLFTPQFKQEQIARLAQQELTLAELARELVVAPQLIRQWQRLSATCTP